MEVRQSTYHEPLLKAIDAEVSRVEMSSSASQIDPETVALSTNNFIVSPENQEGELFGGVIDRVSKY